MSSDLFVNQVRQATQDADWALVSHCVQQFLSGVNRRADGRHSSERKPRRKESMSDRPAAAAPHLRSETAPSPSSLTVAAEEPAWAKDTADMLAVTLYALQVSDFQGRWDIAKVIPDFGVGAIAPLATLIDDAIDADDWELLWFIARSLGEIGHPAAIAPLLTLLTHVQQQASSEADVVDGVVSALARLGDGALPTLRSLLPHPQTRLAAVQALAQLRRPGAVDMLLEVAQGQFGELEQQPSETPVEALDASDIDARDVAIAALSVIHQPQVAAVLRDNLTAPAAKIRRAAVAGLGLQTDVMAADAIGAAIAPLLWDVNLEVRRQVVASLRRLKTAAAVDYLAQALASTETPEVLKPDIVRSLVWMEIPEAFAAIEAWVDCWVAAMGSADRSSRSHRGHPLPTVLLGCEVATALGQVQQPDLLPGAVALLVQMAEALHVTHAPFDHPSEPLYGGHLQEIRLRQAIAYSLGQLRHPAGQATLKNLCQDADEGVRLHAQAAYSALVI